MTKTVNCQKENYPKVYLYKRIVQAKLFIDKNFDKNIDLNNISDEAYFSKFHFIRLFKNAYGKTPHQYLTQLKIEKARQLLASGQTVSLTCHSVGFESLGSFSRLFKKAVGISPTLYCKQQQEFKEKMNKQPIQFVPNCFAEHYGWAKKAISDNT